VELSGELATLRLGGFSLSRHRLSERQNMLNNITYRRSRTCTDTVTERHRSQSMPWPIAMEQNAQQLTHELEVWIDKITIPTYEITRRRGPREDQCHWYLDWNTNFGALLSKGLPKHVRSVLNILRHELATRLYRPQGVDRLDESHTQGGQHFTLTGYKKTLENENKNYEERRETGERLLFFILMEKETHVFLNCFLRWLMGLRLAVQFGKSGFGL
jgi:hypothetical protein